MNLVGFVLVGKVFKKAFRILGIDERKSRWVVEFKIFMEIFRPKWHGFLPFNFSGVLDSIVPLLVWFERSLHSAQLSDDITSGRRDMDRHGWLEVAQG